MPNPEPPVGRTPEECQQELEILAAAHVQNETGRDGFVALAHTALFASSVAFYSDIVAEGTVQLVWLLVLAWLSSVAGLICLTVSFSAAAAELDSRIKALYELTPPELRTARRLNSIALWTFPIALLSIFAFAAVNVVHMSEPKDTTVIVVPLEKGVTAPQRAPTRPTPGTGVVPPARPPAAPQAPAAPAPSKDD